jgi:hypothetical protein
MFFCQNLKIFPEDEILSSEEKYYIIKFSSFRDKQLVACSATIYKNDLAIRSESKVFEISSSFDKYDLYGLLIGLELANKLEIKHVIVESSNESIITALNDSIFVHKFISRVKNIESQLLTIITDLNKKFDSIKYNLISHQENMSVYNLSKNKILEYI